jgi:hypothetical protein
LSSDGGSLSLTELSICFCCSLLRFRFRLKSLRLAPTALLPPFVIDAVVDVAVLVPFVDSTPFELWPFAMPAPLLASIVGRLQA